jgi:pyruvate dehydrogenase E1 component alpha subunit
MGTSAIVAGGIALAVGAALASKMRQDKKVSVAFFGDGAVDEGTFHESLNFAALKKLPVVFVCENNLYATNSPQSARQPLDNIYKRGEAYGIPGFQLDGNSVLEIYGLAKQAISRARQDEGPTLIECRTYRWKGHVGPECDYEKGCRSKEELEDWMEKCPVETYRDYLIKNKLVSVSEINDAIKAIDKDIESALKFAKDSAFPESDALFKDVYYQR